MGRNVEIKATVENVESFRRRVEKLADEGPTLIQQEDVFFHCPTGRLKLRIFSASRGELIAYDRADSSGPRISQYRIVPTDNPTELRELLTASLGVRIIVRKTRILYMIGQTRVHCDSVENLGDFVELEVVLTLGQNEADGQEIASALMTRLEISEKNLILCAYADLLDGEG